MLTATLSHSIDLQGRRKRINKVPDIISLDCKCCLAILTPSHALIRVFILDSSQVSQDYGKAVR